MIRRLSLLLIGLSLAVPAGAAVFTVTKTADTLDGACDLLDCSLREAIAAANATGGTDVVSVPAGIYTLSRAGAGEEFGATGDLDVNEDLILVGAGAGKTILDGLASDRVLDIYSRAEIFGVTIRKGRVDGDGGGVLVRPSHGNYTVVLRRVVLERNEARNGGGVATQHGTLIRESALYSNRGKVYGGGIASDGAGGVQLLNSTLSDNLAEGSGGGFAFVFEGAPFIEGSTIAFNQAAASGGGLHGRHAPFPGDGSAELRGSIVARNEAPEQPDCSGATSLGYNVVGIQGSCDLVATDKSGTAAAPLDPKLAAISVVFGYIPVHVVLPGSPALGAVAAEACLEGDQLGQARSSPCEAGALESMEQPACIPGGSVLCLQEGRFRVSAFWHTNTAQGAAQALPLTDDTGSYWFFSPDNLEIMVKVLNGCALNQSWWVFTNGLTDVGVSLHVEDLVTGEHWVVAHPYPKIYLTRLDTKALPCGSVGSNELRAARASSAASPPTAVLVVTKTADTLDGACDHDCSLREAVAAANATAGTGVILLGPGVYTLSLPGIDENEARTGDLDVTGNLVLFGAGAERTILDGGGIDRVLDIRPKSGIEIYDSTLRNGHARPGALETGEGGGIRALGPLRLVRTLIADNVSESGGGGVFGFSDFVVRDSTVSGNFAKLFGGGLWGNVQLFNVTISGNEALNEGGGLFLALDETVLQNVTITGNKATLGGGLSVSIPDCPYICYGLFQMEHTIVAGNEGNSFPDCWEATAHYGEHNFFGVGEGCFPGTEDEKGTLKKPLDMRLLPLGMYGGPTPTHALSGDSPAVDAASEECLQTDQRGRPRPAAKCDAGAFELLSACLPDEQTLCLGAGDRFRATVRWTALGQTGAGKPIPLTLDSGAFWFFDPANVELTLKVLDGCGVNDRFWVFLSGLTNVGVEIEVEDTRTGKTWAYEHSPGPSLQPVLDTSSMDVCNVSGDPL